MYTVLRNTHVRMWRIPLLARGRFLRLYVSAHKKLSPRRLLSCFNCVQRRERRDVDDVVVEVGSRRLDNDYDDGFFVSTTSSADNDDNVDDDDDNDFYYVLLVGPMLYKMILNE